MLWWLPLCADASTLLTAQVAGLQYPLAGKVCRQPAPDRDQLSPVPPEVPPASLSGGNCRWVPSAGTCWSHVSAGLAGVGLLLLGAMPLSSHSQVGQQGSRKVHCDKKQPFDKLEKKMRPSIFINKKQTSNEILILEIEKAFSMRGVWKISVFTKKYFTARNLSCPGNKSMCFKGMGKPCTFQVTSL